MICNMNYLWLSINAFSATEIALLSVITIVVFKHIEKKRGPWALIIIQKFPHRRMAFVFPVVLKTDFYAFIGSFWEKTWKKLSLFFKDFDDENSNKFVKTEFQASTGTFLRKKYFFGRFKNLSFLDYQHKLRSFGGKFCLSKRHSKR